jgi:hypothetical protein
VMPPNWKPKNTYSRATHYTYSYFTVKSAKTALLRCISENVTTDHCREAIQWAMEIYWISSPWEFDYVDIKHRPKEPWVGNLWKLLIKACIDVVGIANIEAIGTVQIYKDQFDHSIDTARRELILAKVVQYLVSSPKSNLVSNIYNLISNTAKLDENFYSLLSHEKLNVTFRKLLGRVEITELRIDKIIRQILIDVKVRELPEYVEFVGLLRTSVMYNIELACSRKLSDESLFALSFLIGQLYRFEYDLNWFMDYLHPVNYDLLTKLAKSDKLLKYWIYVTLISIGRGQMAMINLPEDADTCKILAECRKRENLIGLPEIS